VPKGEMSNRFERFAAWWVGWWVKVSKRAADRMKPRYLAEGARVKV